MVWGRPMYCCTCEKGFPGEIARLSGSATWGRQKHTENGRRRCRVGPRARRLLCVGTSAAPRARRIPRPRDDAGGFMMYRTSCGEAHTTRSRVSPRRAVGARRGGRAPGRGWPGPRAPTRRRPPGGGRCAGRCCTLRRGGGCGVAGGGGAASAQHGAALVMREGWRGPGRGGEERCGAPHAGDAAGEAVFPPDLPRPGEMIHLPPAPRGEDNRVCVSEVESSTGPWASEGEGAEMVGETMQGGEARGGGAPAGSALWRGTPRT